MQVVVLVVLMIQESFFSCTARIYLLNKSGIQMIKIGFEWSLSGHQQIWKFQLPVIGHFNHIISLTIPMVDAKFFRKLDVSSSLLPGN